MVDLVAFSFDIEHQRPCLLLHIADEVIVISEFVLWLEEHFHLNLALSRNHPRDWHHSERVSVVGVSFDGLFEEIEAKRNVLLIDDVHYFSVLAIEEEWSKLDLSSFKEDIRLIYSSNNHEVLLDIFLRDFENPERFMLANVIWYIFEGDLELFP